MGKRDQYETITKVIRAFADNQSWRQADLAAHLGVEARRLRTILLNLSESGMPLTREEEHPHVYWNVPRQWFPGGVYFDQDEWDLLLQSVLHVPDESRRKRMLTRLLRGRVLGNVDEKIERLERGIFAQPVEAKVQQATLLIQQAIIEHRPLRVEYFSASSGRLTQRTLSPQRLLSEPHPRLVAYCHSNQALRWFRLENIQNIKIDDSTMLHDVAPEVVDGYVGSSPDGFHDGTETEWSFVVAPEAATWVRSNLLPGMKAQDERPDGMRVVVKGGALVVARFVVSLGGQALAEQQDLRDLVCDLAERALRCHQAETE